MLAPALDALMRCASVRATAAATLPVPTTLMRIAASGSPVASVGTACPAR